MSQECTMVTIEGYDPVVSESGRPLLVNQDIVEYHEDEPHAIAMGAALMTIIDNCIGASCPFFDKCSPKPGVAQTADGYVGLVKPDLHIDEDGLILM